MSYKINKDTYEDFELERKINRERFKERVKREKTKLESLRDKKLIAVFDKLDKANKDSDPALLAIKVRQNKPYRKRKKKQPQKIKRRSRFSMSSYDIAREMLRKEIEQGIPQPTLEFFDNDYTIFNVNKP